MVRGSWNPCLGTYKAFHSSYGRMDMEADYNELRCKSQGDEGSRQHGRTDSNSGESSDMMIPQTVRSLCVHTCGHFALVSYFSTERKVIRFCNLVNFNSCLASNIFSNMRSNLWSLCVGRLFLTESKASFIDLCFFHQI